MGKLFSVIGVTATIGAAFVGGMCAVMYAYAKCPEMGHRHVDALSEAYAEINKKEA